MQGVLRRLHLRRESSFTHCHAVSPHRKCHPPAGRARAGPSSTPRPSLPARAAWARCRSPAVAERAGIAAGTVYRYFPSKTDLVAELVAAVAGRELDAMRRPATRRRDRCRRWRPAISTFAARALSRAPARLGGDRRAGRCRCRCHAARLPPVARRRTRRRASTLPIAWRPSARAGRARGGAGAGRRADGRAARAAGAVA